MPNTQLLTDATRVRLPVPLAVALRETAQQRGVTTSDIIRLAIARELASIANPKRPAQPAQSNPVR